MPLHPLPRLLRAAVLAYPVRFRAQFGADLGAALADRWHALAALPPVAARWQRALLVVHTAASGLAERGAAMRRLTWRTQHPHLYAFTGRRATMWDTLRCDVLAALRGLTAARAFSLLTIAALALGLGANSAVFAVVDGVLMRPLPYQSPDRLAMLWSENPRMQNASNPISPANFDDLKRMTQSFEALDYALSFIVPVGLEGQEDQGSIQILRIGPTLLQVLGARAARPPHGAGRARRGGRQ